MENKLDIELELIGTICPRENHNFQRYYLLTSKNASLSHSDALAWLAPQFSPDYTIKNTHVCNSIEILEKSRTQVVAILNFHFVGFSNT